MPSSFVRTNRPGIYRRGNSYYATVTVNGVTRKVRAGPKQKDAERLKTRLEADRNKGVDITALRERERFADYARSWIASYSGRGRDHVSERTRTEYARDLERHVIPWMQETAIGYIRPQTIDDLIAHLQNDTDLADATIKRVLAPVKACLGDAYRRGDIATNPALGVRVRSRRKVVESDEEQAKALTRVELAALIEAVDPRWRPLIELLASTGLRISEALALRWSDVDLGNRPSLKVVRAVKHGQAEKTGTPKSVASRRTVPLSEAMARTLRLRRAETEWGRDEDYMFCSSTGTLMSDGNLRRRVLTPAAKAAGVPWCGFHTLRHTFASLLFAEGRNVKQVQRLMGHGDPGFTLRTYIHLLGDDTGGPLDLYAALRPADECEPERVAAA